jgi:RNase P/RNase MRP subunit p29
MAELVGSSVRVNGATLPKYVGREVRVIGKVVQQANGSAVLQASDVSLSVSSFVSFFKFQHFFYVVLLSYFCLFEF